MGFQAPAHMMVNEQFNERILMGPKFNYKKTIECPNKSTMNVFVADFGRQNKKICPLPSLYVFYSSLAYCETIQKFFRSLVEKYFLVHFQAP